LCPGATETNFFKADQADKATLLTKVLPLPSARSVAMAGWRAMGSGRRVIVTGWTNKVFTLMPRLLPRRFVAWSVGLFLARR
jgi:short-subunit dehydrogenase